jgi:hypothetical protein
MEFGLFGKIMLGVLALVAIWIFRPGIKAMMQQSREAENKDWAGLALPIGLVVLFVILLLSAV